MYLASPFVPIIKVAKHRNNTQKNKRLMNKPKNNLIRLSTVRLRIILQNFLFFSFDCSVYTHLL